MAQDGARSPGELAEHYLVAVAGQDWDTVAASLDRQVIRHGPFGDDVRGLDDYLSFLRRTMPSLPGYRMDIDRVTDLGHQRALVELRETVDVDGQPLLTHECLVFEVNAAGLLAEIAVYIRQSPDPPEPAA
jgi:limonene-1,2-epoxide hydrolase